MKYKSLLEELGSSDRLDAEYYQPKYEDLNKFLSTIKTKLIDEIVEIKKSIEPGSDFYCDEGVPFIRVSDINKFQISDPEIKKSFALHRESERLLEQTKAEVEFAIEYGE